jgi:hypothetical protein
MRPPFGLNGTKRGHFSVQVAILLLSTCMHLLFRMLPIVTNIYHVFIEQN